MPISFALTYPGASGDARRRRSTSREGLSLEFEPPDLETFPLLALARRRGRVGRHVPVRLQRGERGRRRGVPRRAAARSSDIAGVVEETLDAVDGAPAGDLDELVEADAEARRLAESAAGALVA